MTLSSIKGTSILLIFLVVPFLNACKSKQPATERQNAEQTAKGTLVISFERTSCFGKCPTFIANFYSDGKVSYHGINNVEYKGNFQGKVASSEIEGIYKTARDIGFFSMNDKYDGNITDVPSQLYFIAMHGEEQNVFARYKTPPELKTLGEYIDKVLEAIQWVPVEGLDH